MLVVYASRLYVIQTIKKNSIADIRISFMLFTIYREIQVGFGKLLNQYKQKTGKFGILDKIKFIDTFRFMSRSLSSLVDNLKNFVKISLDYMMFKHALLIFRCFECKNYYKQDFNKDLMKTFPSMYEFCNRDIDKFILFLREGV